MVDLWLRRVQLRRIVVAADLQSAAIVYKDLQSARHSYRFLLNVEIVDI